MIKSYALAGRAIKPALICHMKPPKRPTLASLQAEVSDFNERHPIGTPVIYHRLIHPLRDPRPTKTRSEAWVMGGHSAMVLVDGVSGGVSLEAVTVP